MENLNNVAAEAEFDDPATTTVVGAGEPGGLNVPVAAAHRDHSVLSQLCVLATVGGLAAVVFDYEHGMAGFHWFHHWVRERERPLGVYTKLGG